MCTAQVLLLTDVMRRNDYGRTDALPPRTLCRKLFVDDAPDPVRTAKFLETLETQIQKEARDRWNFDFQKEVPLPGRYQWVPVRPRTNSAKVPQAGPSSVGSEMGSGTCGSDRVVESTAVRQTSKRSKVVTKSQGSKGVTQPKITDFLLQRKRQRTAELELTSSSKLKLRRLNAHTDAQATSN